MTASSTLSRRLYHAVALSAVASFLVPPMFFITLLAFATIAAGNPYNWLIAGPLIFAALTSIHAPASQPTRIVIAILNAVILVAVLALNAIMFSREGFVPTIKN